MLGFPVVVWFKCHDDTIRSRLEGLSEFISTLINAAAVHFVTPEEQVPDGCAINTVNHDCEAHLLLKVLC